MFTAPPYLTFGYFMSGFVLNVCSLLEYGISKDLFIHGHVSDTLALGGLRPGSRSIGTSLHEIFLFLVHSPRTFEAWGCGWDKQ